jgi:hypothetical protein
MYIDMLCIYRYVVYVCVCMETDKGVKMDGRTVMLERAPDPTDIIWENLSVPVWSQVCVIIISIIIVIISIATIVVIIIIIIIIIFLLSSVLQALRVILTTFMTLLILTMSFAMIYEAMYLSNQMKNKVDEQVCIMHVRYMYDACMLHVCYMYVGICLYIYKYIKICV